MRSCYAPLLAACLLPACLLLTGAAPTAWADDAPVPRPAAASVTDLTVRPVRKPRRRGDLRFRDFYTRYTTCNGLVIQASDRPADEALLEAAWIVRNMLAKRPDLLDTLRWRGIRISVMAHDELTTRLPEHATLAPAKWWDYRARGLGPGPRRPIVSCAEENLLGYAGDPYRHESILVHEFAHAIDLEAVRRLDPEFEARLAATYQAALAQGLWKGCYAATNKEEYWAEGVQSWFDANGRPDASHNDIDTRAELAVYDPALAALIRSVFGENPWRYRPAPGRVGRGHLKAHDPDAAPTFRWPEGLADWYHEHERKKQTGEGHERLPVLPGSSAPKRSPVTKAKTLILFVNEGAVDVRLYWLGYDGTRKPYGTVRAGAMAERETLVRHVWIVTDAQDRELARFRAGERPGRAVIRPPSGNK